MVRKPKRDSLASCPRLAVAALILVSLGPSLPCPGQSPLQRFTYDEWLLGSRVRLVFYASTRPVANEASSAAFARIKQLDGVLSSYRGDSELARVFNDRKDASAEFSARRAVPVSPDLWRVLAATAVWHRRSGGLFDPTVAPLARLWKRAIRRHELPDPERLEAACRLVGFRHLRLDHQAGTVNWELPGIRLDLGGIAKGYIADEALGTLRTFGIRRAMVDAGGDLAIGEAPPNAAGWRIGFDLAGPVAGDATAESGALPMIDGCLVLQSCGVATSGDRFQSVVIDGKRYTHLVNPLTGVCVSEPTTATVVAADAMTADVLATCVSILGPQAGFPLVQQQRASALARPYGSPAVQMTEGVAAYLEQKVVEP